MTDPLVTVISGGLGGARLALALKAAGLASGTCFVTNVGDDLVIDGLLVCPDTDSVLYALAECFDEERGWGVLGDTFAAARGEYAWFNVGNRDREHHRRRRQLLDEGLRLAEVTRQLAEGLGVTSRLVPATDDEVRTHVVTDVGRLAWQEWLVRERAQPVPAAVEYRGCAHARANPEAIDAIERAAIVVIAPSSPVASVAPILAVQGFTAALAARPGPTVAITPVVTRRPPRTDRDRRRAHARAALLATVGRDHTPVAVAGFYRGLIDTFVLDPADADDVDEITPLGCDVFVAPDVTTTVEGLTALVRVLGPEHSGTTTPH